MTNTGWIKSILSKCGADEVILFGSRAVENADEYSDYDILAVFDSELSRKEELRIASSAREALAQKFIDVDVLIRTRAEVNAGKQQIGNIIRTAISQGITL